MPTLIRRAAPTLALVVLATAAAGAPAQQVAPVIPAPGQQVGPGPIVVPPQVRPGFPIPQPTPANPLARAPALSPNVSGGIPWPIISPGASRLPGAPGVLRDRVPPAAPAARRRRPVAPFQMNAWWGFEPGARLGYIPLAPVATVVVQPGVFVPGSSDPSATGG